MIVVGHDPGAEHRAMAWISIDREACSMGGAAMLGPDREDVARFFQQVLAEEGRAARDIPVAVEMPSGVAYGQDVAQIKGRSKYLMGTMRCAERVASVAYGMGFPVVEYAAAEVRGSLCLHAQAKDPVVRAVVRANVRNIVPGVHIADALAVALFEGARLTGYEIRRDNAFMQARGRQKAAAAIKKLPASVQAAMLKSPGLQDLLRQQEPRRMRTHGKRRLSTT